jgi:hypothetical protein
MQDLTPRFRCYCERSPSFWLLFIGDARKRSFVKAEFLRAQKIATSEKLKSNQPPVCHRQWKEIDLDHQL